MKKVLAILFLPLYINSFAQKLKTKKIKLQDAAMQAFVASNKTLHYIQFKKDNDSELELRPDTVIKQFKNAPYENWYSMDYLGEKYLFETQFGEFPKKDLLRKLDSLSHKNCDFSSYEGKIYADHIVIEVTSICPGESKDRNPVFQKMNYHIHYPGGPTAFTRYLQSKIPAGIQLLPQEQPDSVLFFRAYLMRKDSMIHDVKPLDSTVSELSNIIQIALKETKGWTPFFTGGFSVNGYAEIFVRLRKDGTIEADYRR